jgi:hypothetical protein
LCALSLSFSSFEIFSAQISKVTRATNLNDHALQETETPRVGHVSARRYELGTCQSTIVKNRNRHPLASLDGALRRSKEIEC